jgi:hypothetical protein
MDTSGGGLSNLEVSGSDSGPTEPTEDGCGLNYVGVEFADSTGLLSSAVHQQAKATRSAITP